MKRIFVDTSAWISLVAEKDPHHESIAGEWLSILDRKILALVFEKPSLRTRVSFEVAMQQLGGSAIYLSPAEVGLGSVSQCLTWGGCSAVTCRPLLCVLFLRTLLRYWLPILLSPLLTLSLMRNIPARPWLIC
jgi:hypothetical protein